MGSASGTGSDVKTGRKSGAGGKPEGKRRNRSGQKTEEPPGVDNTGKPDAMEGFRPGPGNTGSVNGRDEVGHGQVNHKI